MKEAGGCGVGSLSKGLWRDPDPPDFLISDFWAPELRERINYSGLNLPVCGTFLWRPRESRVTARNPKEIPKLQCSLKALCMEGVHPITCGAREGMDGVQTRGSRKPGGWQSVCGQNPIWPPFSGVYIIPAGCHMSLEFTTWLRPSGSNPCSKVTSSERSSSTVSEQDSMRPSQNRPPPMSSACLLSVENL